MQESRSCFDQRRWNLNEHRMVEGDYGNAEAQSDYTASLHNDWGVSNHRGVDLVLIPDHDLTARDL
jgi:hypothetical protein